MPGVASLLFFLTLGGSLGFLVAGAASLFSIPALLLLIATLAVFWTLLRALLAAAGRAGPAVSRTGVFASALGRRAVFERSLLPAAATLVVVPAALLEHV